MSASKPPTAFAFADPQAAIEAVAGRLLQVSSEPVAVALAAGRVLRSDIRADRDSPAADVSAMDGYAVRAEDLQHEDWVPIGGESAPGHRPPQPSPGTVLRIFTGAIVPAALDRVIRREDTEETADAVRWKPAARQAEAGQNIRRQGENSPRGTRVVSAGRLLDAGAIAAAANFGATPIEVASPVRVAVIVTGDELRGAHEAVDPWQLRDSNGATLAALLKPHAPAIECVMLQTVPDRLEALVEVIADGLSRADAMVLTGGVSMGNHDYVPAAIQRCGGEIVFHRLPIRPGKPLLGATTASGQLILGLPGNPVSAAACARRFLLPLLAQMAGARLRPPTQVAIANPDSRTLPLWWMRLVRIDAEGRAELIAGKGSGDLVALAGSDGIVQQPRDRALLPESLTLPFWSWQRW